MLAVVPEQIGDQHARHIDASNCGGPAGADRAHRGRAPFAVDQNPIEDSVDDVCGDQSKGHRSNHVHCLKAAANGEVK